MSHLIFAPATAAPDAGADIAKQTAVTLARLDERLRAERPSLADAVVITVDLRRAADFPAMNDEYRQALERRTADPHHRRRRAADAWRAGGNVRRRRAGGVRPADRHASRS